MRPSLREGVWIVILPTLSHRAIRALDVHQSLLYSSQKSRSILGWRNLQGLFQQLVSQFTWVR